MGRLHDVVSAEVDIGRVQKELHLMNQRGWKLGAVLYI